VKDVTTEVPCPIPDCGSIVYAPNDSDSVRIDCLDCGAALLTRRGIDGAVTLEVTEDAMNAEDLGAPPPPLAAGRHVAAFDVSEPSNDLDSKEETHG
jgi:ribosomal protein S27E